MNVNLRRAVVTALSTLPMLAFAGPKADLYKHPQCGCCEEYANYLRDNGYEVNVKPTHDLSRISREAGIPEALEGCHTMFVDGYAVSGHVPVDVVDKLLAERPSIAGITLPGMPLGSPGMSGPKSEPFRILMLPRDGSAPKEYAVR